MILQILAAAALAGAPAAASPSTTVSGVDVHPPPPNAPPDATVDAPGDDETIGNAVAVWPEGAYEARLDGQARLSCLVDAFGLAEACSIVSETPPGHGFGKAAMELRPTFKLTPARGPDGPVSATMTIAVRFKAPDPQFTIGGSGGPMTKPAIPSGQVTHNPLAMRSVTMLDHPVWTHAASYDDLARAYPAKANGAQGYAVAHCQVARSGTLSDCQVIKELPEKDGFGAAAVNLASQFRVSADQAGAPHHTPLWVDVPIRFFTPAAARTVVSPTWLAGVDPDAAPKVFPPEAAALGLTTGRGVARCVVRSDGTMAACEPDAADPSGPGFAEAAAKLAATMRMNPWSADAAPVDGAVVRVAIRLNLKGAP